MDITKGGSQPSGKRGVRPVRVGEADMALRGLVIGLALLLGSLLARRAVDKIAPRAHAWLIDAVLVVAAGGMIMSLAGAA